MNATETIWGVAPPARTVLTHAEWSLTVEGDRLENVSFAGVRVLRSIRCVVRDRDWRTFPMRDARLEVLDDSAERLTARVSALAELDGQRVAATLTLDLDGDTLRAHVRAETLTPVVRARLGLIVLHPLEDSGTVMTVVHADGGTTRAPLGPSISPHQPAQDIAGLRWSRSGLDADLALTGDVFEMEDQRNWTDASFKTYSTPLSLPFPVELPAGEVIEHSLMLHMTGTPATTARPAATPGELRTGEDLGPLPTLALGATTESGDVLPLPDSLPVGVLVEVPLDSPSARDIVDRAIVEADGAPLDVRLHGTDPTVVSALVHDLVARARRADLRLSSLGVTNDRGQVTDDALWSALTSAVLDAGLVPGDNVDLVAGARSHFTELNRRQHDLPEDAPWLCFSLTPQMHDEATAQIIESLDVLPQLLQDARRIAGDRPLAIGPLTLRARYNAVATTAAPEPGDVARTGYDAALVSRATDPRWLSPAAGPWLLGALQRLALPGVGSIAVGEVRGPRGVVREDGTLTAAGEVLAWYAAHAEGTRVALEGLPEGVMGLAVRMPGSSDRVELMLGNLREEPVPLDVTGPEQSIQRLRLAPGALESLSA